MMGFTWGDYGALEKEPEPRRESARLSGERRPSVLYLAGSGASGSFSSALSERGGRTVGVPPQASAVKPCSLSASGRAAASPGITPHAPQVPVAPGALTFMVAPVRRGPS